MQPFLATAELSGDAEFRFRTAFNGTSPVVPAEGIARPPVMADDVRSERLVLPPQDLAAPIEAFAPAQVTPDPTDTQPTGHVAILQGGVLAIRNGIAVTLNAGDAVFKDDVIQTEGSDAAAGIVFNDGTTVDLTSNALPQLLLIALQGSSAVDSVDAFAFVAPQPADHATDLAVTFAAADNVSLAEGRPPGGDESEAAVVTPASIILDHPDSSTVKPAASDDPPRSADRDADQDNRAGDFGPLTDTCNAPRGTQVYYVEATIVSDTKHPAQLSTFAGDGTPDEARVWVNVQHQSGDTWKLDVPTGMASLSQATATNASPASDSFAFQPSIGSSSAGGADMPATVDAAVSHTADAGGQVVITTPAGGDSATLASVHTQLADPTHNFHVVV